MKAVVMAGGEGSRLRPLTSRRPKPLAPIANKPVMHHIIELLARHGITEIVATLHYLADEIETYFGDGSSLGVSIQYVVEDTPLGTAGAVKMAEAKLRDETFVIISGDAMTDVDLTALIEAHKRANNAATIALWRVTDPLEFGVVIAEDDGRITRFMEKPSWGEVFSDTINTGIYVLEPEIFGYMEPGRNYDFSKDIFPLLLRDGKRLGGHVISDYWADVGNLQQYQQANYDALSGAVRTRRPPDQLAYNVWIGADCSIDPSASISGPVQFGDGVTVGPGAVIEGPSCIGDGSIVEAGATIRRSVLWENVYAGDDAQLTDCTIANRTIVKARASIGEGTVVGERCVIGESAVVRPHLRLWPEKNVSSGAIVSMSLIYGIKWPGSLFGGVGVTGLANLEITPEFALKLGQAFGSFLRAGDSVMTSRDTHPSSRIMNRCIISGLLSVGVNVLDLRSYPLPLSRFATRTGGNGGVHVRIAPGDPHSLLVEFFDRSGINVDKATERKIENLFFREDFRRVAMDDVGLLDFPARALESYTAAFLEALAPKGMHERRFRLVIDYANGNAALVLPRILSKLNIETIALNAYFDDNRVHAGIADRAKSLDQLSDIVCTLKTDLGILLDHDGETFALVDDRGRIVDGNALIALLTLLVVRGGAKTIAVPVMAPGAIETIAAEYGASVIRARSDRRSLMALAEARGKELAFAGGANYEVIFPEMHPAFDALYASAKVMELLAREGRRLSELVDMLPDWHVATVRVPCPWEHKGRVMRSLIAEQPRDQIELFEGLRVRHDDGWVLVLPDASDPTFSIYAEATSDGEAYAYAERMGTRIEQLAGV
ncbi:MAG TPA: mannose-1-phosphate guanyltransferase [Candidatus Baltobacteraceae bacterium]|nr:mannose-1-phosphate guanyltransferase [Candidatus Baltobacteraceae bacterium]